MDDVTDTVFRQIVAGLAPPDLYFTEFVNVDGLQSAGRDRVMKKLQHTAKERPLIAQLWGKNPDNFYQTAQELADMGFAGIDLNMGCPVKAVFMHGTCSALIANRELAHDIIQATQDGAHGKLPVSVKTRLGLNEVDYTWHEFLLEHKLDMLTIHGRTRREMSDVPAHWDAIGEIRKLRDKVAPDTLMVGNGDVESRQQGQELAEQYGLDGIMIGRGVFHDPYVFSADSPWERISPRERLELYEKHIRLFTDTWENAERRIHSLNKFCKIYVNGFEGAKEWRERLMTAKTSDELLSLVQDVKVSY